MLALLLFQCINGNCQPSPFHPVQPQPAQQKEAPNYGIQRDGKKFSENERFYYNSVQVSKEDAKRFVQGGRGVPDDRNQPWLIAVSPTTEAQKKAKALLSGLSSKFRIQSYTEREWYTKDPSGNEIYKPGLTVLSPDGKTVVTHYGDIEEGFKELRLLPEGFDPLKLLDLLLALRRQPPPSPIPNPLPPPFPSPIPTPPDLPKWANSSLWAALAFLMFLWMILGGKKQ